MEADYLTSGDLAMWESNRHCYKHRDGMAATGIGLAAVQPDIRIGDADHRNGGNGRNPNSVAVCCG